jgi:two-component system C4-dicarboxylate transport response regulator DctD
MEPVILLVDDDDGSRDAMRRALERVEYRVEAFADAQEALERIESGEPVDAVISDVRMPGMDGYELLQRVRALRPALPFLLVTAYGDVDQAVNALQEGADDYLTKPVKMQELRRRVQLHLERRVLSDENRGRWRSSSSGCAWSRRRRRRS